MHLEEVLPAYREGKKIRRKKWDERYIHTRHENELVRFCTDDIDATDWEIIEDPITITREQFERAWWKVYPERHPATMDKLWEALQK